MARKSILFFLVLILSVFTRQAFAGQICNQKTCFDSEVHINGETVPLRGMGLLEFLKIDMYTAALYVPQSAQSIEEILGETPKRLELNYHRNIKVEWMNKAAAKTMAKNPEVDFDKIRERVEKISAAYLKVESDDRYALQYEPGEGTTLFLNGMPQIMIPGLDFAHAYFGIWLSEFPANAELRDKLIQ